MFFWTNKAETQQEKIINMLSRRPRKPYEFTNEGIMSYTKIISVLKKKGWRIECKQEVERNTN